MKITDDALTVTSSEQSRRTDLEMKLIWTSSGVLAVALQQF